ncbi:conserved hypothetical protein [Nitrosomonas nitrosa]|uniref:STAND NTPase 4 small alpha/beta domain-containing protein n=1 Tax=Nitrosomonas nitrosa TaxID=52442 RepID=A0A8H8Z238_9PROT|nr:hypothetical protein [Nitrosomonas nitrosa]CAE6518972.1 conserved hypothetical protein [Nitrosomonas nitrosa]
MKLYKIFLASPGDTETERKLANDVVSEINKTIGSRNHFRLELLKWENNTYPTFGEDVQDIINKQIGSDYQIFVGIMWKKFGTPTKRAGSGTAEEFELAYNRYVKTKDIQIMFYFNNSPIPQDADFEQFQNVKNFKKKLEALGGYCCSYDTPKSFEKLLREHLTSYLLDIKESANPVTQNEAKPYQKVIPEIKASFKDFLNDIEAQFAHSKIDDLRLEDIYIAPDLKDLKDLNNSKKSNSTKVTNLDKLSDVIDVNGIKYVLLGNDSSGKSASSKYLFVKYFNLGFYPVLLNGLDIGNNIRIEVLKNLIETKILEQYEYSFKLNEIDSNRIILIIDDFHRATKGKNRYWPALMKNIENEFLHIVVTGNTLMPIENLNKQDPLENFKLFVILEFGPKFRYQLVNKWNTLGIEARFLDQNELLRKNDLAVSHIQAIIGRNYIPSYPFYLLAILQAMESGNVQNPNYSIHGFYYEVLINECFSKAIKDKKEISLYYNYLTQLCFHLFTLGVKELSIEEFESFHNYYCEKHDLTYKKEAILETFDTAKLLYVNNKVYIKEKYVYFFFVAKYIANEIANKFEIREIVTKMSQRAFRDEYASIIMFVTHLSKDTFIINELIRNANAIFSESHIAKLQDDINSINQLVEDLPEQILEIVDVKKKRDDELAEEEEIERLEKELEKEPSNYDNFTLDDDLSTIDFFAKITLALKTIDILGQIAKKHWGEINGEQKLNLVMATYNLGLRTLDFYLKLLQRNSKDIVEHIGQLIEKKHFKDRYSLKQNIDETARNFVFRLCFMSSFGITKRVANAIGYDKLKNSFEKALIAQPYNSIKLIDLAIKLGYSSISNHIDLIDEYKNNMDKNKLSLIVLQNIVIDYMYMFDTDYKTKDRLCNKLGISVQEQLKIDSTSTVKKKKIFRA